MELTNFIMITAGFILLFAGGEGLLKGTVAIAHHYKLSRILVSAVIIGFGTSLPELTVSVSAILKDAPGIALGNIVGSNIANILLIIAIAAIIYPLKSPKTSTKLDIATVLIATLGLCGFAMTGILTFWMGIIMLTALIAYIVFSYINDRSNQTLAKHVEEDIAIGSPLSLHWAIFFSLFGLVFLITGAYLLVEGATSLARNIGISEAIIGLSIVAIGSSLPELATAIIATLRRHDDVIIGNILGSNIFNILGILGITIMLKPISVPAHLLHVDIWVMLGATLFWLFFLWKKITIGRATGLVMLSTYVTYIVLMYQG